MYESLLWREVTNDNCVKNGCTTTQEPSSRKTCSEIALNGLECFIQFINFQYFDHFVIYNSVLNFVDIFPNKYMYKLAHPSLFAKSLEKNKYPYPPPFPLPKITPQKPQIWQWTCSPVVVQRHIELWSVHHCCNVNTHNPLCVFLQCKCLINTLVSKSAITGLKILTRKIVNIYDACCFHLFMPFTVSKQFLFVSKKILHVLRELVTLKYFYFFSNLVFHLFCLSQSVDESELLLESNLLQTEGKVN